MTGDPEAVEPASPEHNAASVLTPNRHSSSVPSTSSAELAPPLTPSSPPAPELSPVAIAAIDLISGSAGGVANVYVGQPLDTIKVKLQTFPHLYAGTVPSLAANVAENAVLFLAYGAAQNLVAATLDKTRKDLNTFENACAGSLASVASATVLTPIEMIKCRMQAMQEVAALEGRPKLRLGPISVTAKILRREGVLAPFKGLSAAIVREMIGYFFFFGTYEMVREAFVKEGETKDDIGPLRTIIAGGLGGVALWLSSYPMDLAKSRIQVLHKGPGRAPFFVFVMMDIAKKEGTAALFSGIWPTLIRTFPATGALFLTVEYSRKLLESLAT